MSAQRLVPILPAHYEGRMDTIKFDARTASPLYLGVPAQLGEFAFVACLFSRGVRGSSVMRGSAHAARVAA